MHLVITTQLQSSFEVSICLINRLRISAVCIRLAEPEKAA